MAKTIYIGDINSPILTFGENEIESVVCENSVTLTGNEMASDAFEATLFFDDSEKTLRNVQYGTPLSFYTDGTLVGQYYVESIKRTGAIHYEITATSLLGIMGNEQFYGGFYTGERFDAVLQDILFSNGIDAAKYNVYEKAATSSTGAEAMRIETSPGRSASNLKKRMHIEFTVHEQYWERATDTMRSNLVAGYHYGTAASNPCYSVLITSYRKYNGESVPEFYWLQVYYGSSWSYGFPNNLTNTPKYGKGSRFSIDVDPETKKMKVVVDYKQYDNLSVSGHDEFVVDLRPDTGHYADSNCPDLGYAFGGMNYSYGSGATNRPMLRMAYDNYTIYNEDGSLYMNAVMIMDTASNTYHAANTATGRISAATTLLTGSTLVGRLGDLSNYERFKKLNSAIVYNNGIDSFTIRGWIPICTRREAMHYLLFSQSVNMLKTDNGEILFTALSETSQDEITDDHIYNEGSEEQVNPAKNILLTEHSYMASGKSAEKIFDNSNNIVGSDPYVVVFDNAPINGAPTAGTGITIQAYNCNAAIVTGRGAITGTPYLHSKNINKHIVGSANGADVSVPDVGLITSVNADTVMNHLKAYYSGGVSIVKNGILYNGEKCGVLYTLKNPFREIFSGYLKKASVVSSAVLKAACEFVKGFKSPSIGGYTEYVLQTYNTSWEVPAEVRAKEDPTIRINLIGKGYDGTAGSAGTAGSSGTINGHASPGAGGAGGTGGAGGKGGNGGRIRYVTIDATNVYRVDISNSGRDTIAKTYNSGGTLLNTYSSSSGVSNATGFVNAFTGIVYGLPGNDGIAGAKGGKGATTSSYAQTTKGENGEGVNNMPGGLTFETRKIVTGGYSDIYFDYYCNYGGGGGASARSAGENSYIYTTRQTNNSSGSQITYYDIPQMKGGNGANGGDPFVTNTTYGCGGTGGNGGGGGGGGPVETDIRREGTRLMVLDAYGYAGGQGGAGGQGSPGIDGCAIIYY